MFFLQTTIEMEALNLFAEENIAHIMMADKTLDVKAAYKKAFEIWKVMPEAEKKPYQKKITDEEMAMVESICKKNARAKKAKQKPAKQAKTVKKAKPTAGKRTYRCGICRQTGHTRAKCGAMVLHEESAIAKTIPKKPVETSSLALVPAAHAPSEGWVKLPPLEMVNGMHTAVLQLQERVSLSEQRAFVSEQRLNRLEEIMERGSNLPKMPASLVNLLTN